MASATLVPSLGTSTKGFSSLLPDAHKRMALIGKYTVLAPHLIQKLPFNKLNNQSKGDAHGSHFPCDNERTHLDFVESRTSYLPLWVIRPNSLNACGAFHALSSKSYSYSYVLQSPRRCYPQHRRHDEDCEWEAGVRWIGGAPSVPSAASCPVGRRVVCVLEHKS